MACKLSIIVFFGSVREGRLGLPVAKYVVETLKGRGHDVTLFDPQEMKFPLLTKTFHEDPEGAPEYVKKAREQIVNADAYVVVSAEYNHSIPPALSNLMDHFPIPDYKHKPCSIVTYSYGQFGGVRAAMQLRSFLGELGLLTPQFILAVPAVHEAFSKDGEPKTDQLAEGGRKMAAELIWLAHALKFHREAIGPPS